MSKIIHRKVVAIATALILVFTLMGTTLFASAKVNTSNNPVGNEDVEFVAEKLNETELKISMKAKQDVTITNVTSYLKWSDNLSYAQTEVTAPSFSESEYNPAHDLFIANSGKNISFSAGDTILYFTVTAKEAIQEETDYSVTFTLDDAFYFDENGRPEGFDWSYDEYTVVYREDAYFSVTFADSGKEVAVQEIKKGETATTPDYGKDNADFLGWYETGAEEAFDFNTPITKEITLQAKYKENTTPASTRVDLGTIPVTKVITKAAKVTAPEETYKFSVTPVTSTTPEYDIDLAITGEDTVYLGEIEFPGPGNYEYKITEVAGNTADMVYDTDTTYYVQLAIIEDAATGNLVLKEFAISPDAEHDPNKKVDSLKFNNKYAPMTTLTVTKYVEGENSLDIDRAFPFTITFTDPGVEKNVSTGSESVAYGDAYSFELADEDTITFNLPAGTDYKLVENGTAAYEATAEIVSGGAQQTDVTGKSGDSITVDSVALVGENTVTVTNKYTVNAITGVIRKNAAIIVAILLAIAAIAALVYDKKRKLAVEEE